MSGLWSCTHRDTRWGSGQGIDKPSRKTTHYCLLCYLLQVEGTVHTRRATSASQSQSLIVDPFIKSVSAGAWQRQRVESCSLSKCGIGIYRLLTCCQIAFGVCSCIARQFHYRKTLCCRPYSVARYSKQQPKHKAVRIYSIGRNQTHIRRLRAASGLGLLVAAVSMTCHTRTSPYGVHQQTTHRCQQRAANHDGGTDWLIHYDAGTWTYCIVSSHASDPSNLTTCPGACSESCSELAAAALDATAHGVLYGRQHRHSPSTEHTDNNCIRFTTPYDSSGTLVKYHCVALNPSFIALPPSIVQALALMYQSYLPILVRRYSTSFWLQ